MALFLKRPQTGDVLFIDEIHRLPKVVKEMFHFGDGDFYIDIVVGEGPSPPGPLPAAALHRLPLYLPLATSGALYGTGLGSWLRMDDITFTTGASAKSLTVRRPSSTLRFKKTGPTN